MACSITYQHQDASVETFKERTDVKANLRCYYIKIKAKNSMETRIAVIGQTPPSEEQIRLILHPKEITIAGGDNLGYSIENKQKFGYCLGYGDSEWYKDLVGDITGKGAVKLEDSSRVYQSTPGDRCGVLAVALAYVDSVVVVGHSIEDGFSIKDTERLKIQKIQAFCWGGVITLVTSAEECHMSVDRSIFRGRVFIKEHGSIPRSIPNALNSARKSIVNATSSDLERGFPRPASTKLGAGMTKQGKINVGKLYNGGGKLYSTVLEESCPKLKSSNAEPAALPKEKAQKNSSSSAHYRKLAEDVSVWRRSAASTEDWRAPTRPKPKSCQVSTGRVWACNRYKCNDCIPGIDSLLTEKPDEVVVSDFGNFENIISDNNPDFSWSVGDNWGGNEQN